MTLGLFAVELMGFLSGVSMFNNNQALLCILSYSTVALIQTDYFTFLNDILFSLTVTLQPLDAMLVVVWLCSSLCLSSGPAASIGGSLLSVGKSCCNFHLV